MAEEEPPKPKLPLKQRIIHEVKHYYNGFRLLFIDIKVATRHQLRLLKGPEPVEEAKETGARNGGEQADDTSQMGARRARTETKTGWVQERVKSLSIRKGEVTNVCRGGKKAFRQMDGEEREGFDVYGEVTVSGGEELRSYVPGKG